MSRKRTRPGEQVVHEQAGPDVATLPDAVMQRDHERKWLDEVWSQGREQQVAFAERLADQGDVPLLEVPQAAVHQLAGSTRRSAGDVALVDEADAEAP
jgi:ABC-type Fe3+/spermidine/putrescine transport system ATPase subunit